MELINKVPSPVWVIYLLALLVIKTQCSLNHIHSFSIDPSESFDAEPHLRTKREAVETEIETQSEEDQKKCRDQKESFAELTEKLKNGERLEETNVFTNETKFNLALAWAGENDNGHLIVLTTETNLFHTSSTLWRSEDHGRNWNDISGSVDNQVFRKDDGLQRNPHRPDKVYLIGHEHFIYRTEDGGKTWLRRDLTEDKIEAETLSIDEVLEFHSLPEYEDYVAVISNDRKLFVTYDNFNSKVHAIKRDVHSVKWGTHAGFEKVVYAVTGRYKDIFTETKSQMLSLERMDANGVWKTLLKGVVLFNVQGKFLYASKYKSNNPSSTQDDRLMMISTDGGDTWKEARLPTLTKDRFYFVLDMTEDLIFIHVDNPGDTGHGIVYTSSSNGVIYSESLRNHLFPNYNTVHDFYKVKSLRGVYLASQMGGEQSIHTVITYNRGGEWKQVDRPKDAYCENPESEGCYLQIHNAYSIHRDIKARLPHSIDKAYGLLLVHAHVAKNLQTSAPDVYLSNDGGYTFKKVLKGPHAYEIADSGGLIVAVPITSSTPDTIKFSTDEGNCWHNYKFTSDSLRFTGLLTEPGGKSMTISIWGYTTDTKKWTVNTIDFNTVVTKECKETDYETWVPHTSLHKGTDQEGCLLGQKETYKRIKHDSWCRNGYNKVMESIQHTCLCTEEDYECDYGFHRPVGKEDCVRQEDIKTEEIEICNGKELDELISLGYRLIPGDKCQVNNKKGFHPTASKEISFEGVCHPGDKKAMEHNDAANANTGSNVLIIIGIVIAVVVLVTAVAVFMGYRAVLLRRHKVVYRYSMLNQAPEDGRDSEFENALVNHDTLYNDMSDEEIEAQNESPQRRPNGFMAGKSGQKGFHDDSDDDMLG